MAHVQVSTLIHASPERVWEIVADLEGQKDWMVDVRRLAVTSEQKLGPGTVIALTSELFGLPLVKDVMEITTWEPNREFGVLHRGGFKGTGAFVLEPIAGGTKFVWWEDFDAPLGPLGELGHRLLVKPHLTKVFSRSLDNLRLLAEGRAQAQAAKERTETPKARKSMVLLAPIVIGTALGIAAAWTIQRRKKPDTDQH